MDIHTEKVREHVDKFYVIFWREKLPFFIFKFLIFDIMILCTNTDKVTPGISTDSQQTPRLV